MMPDGREGEIGKIGTVTSRYRHNPEATQSQYT